MQVAEELVFGDPGLISHADEFGEADVGLLGIVENGHTKGAALGNKPDVPQFGHIRGEGRIHLRQGVRIDEPEAVRSDNSDVMFPADLLDLAFEFDPLATDLLEAGGDDDRGLDPHLPAFIEDLRDSPAGHDDDRQVDIIRYLQYAGIALDAQDACRLGVDRENDPLVAVHQEVGEQRMPDAPRLAGSADDRDRLRIEKRVERGHPLFPFPSFLGFHFIWTAGQNQRTVSRTQPQTARARK